MQIEAQKFLDLVEAADKLAFFDIEATGLSGDYNSILVVSVLPVLGKPVSFSVKQPGNDQKVVREAKEFIASFDCVCGYYSKGFDWKMMNTRLLKWGQDPLPSRHHIDMFYTLKYQLNMSRKSQMQVAGFLRVDEQKMGVSPNVWSEIVAEPLTHMPTMIARCESDVESLRDIYFKTRHLIHDIKRS